MIMLISGVSTILSSLFFHINFRMSFLTVVFTQLKTVILEKERLLNKTEFSRKLGHIGSECFLELYCSMSYKYTYTLRLPDLAERKTSYTVKFEFQIKNIGHILHGHFYTKNYSLFICNSD